MITQQLLTQRSRETLDFDTRAARPWEKPREAFRRWGGNQEVLQQWSGGRKGCYSEYDRFF
jgi:hypothetical protein